MNYTALYRKLRPQTFKEIIGQEHITSTLINQLKSGNVSHAYLFNGTRGTGKTTAARVLAKAVNCLNPINSEPCNKCQMCISISNANNVDVVEMDAASNNGVEYARDIRDKIIYPPSISKFKVYIIDEVHMLSGGAFNALLKTLEEPPAYVIFILCTTEPNKLPATILSRCMRFDFRLLGIDELVKLTQGAYLQANRKYTIEALKAIAQAAEGSARDCLNLADRCLYYSSDTLTYEDVLEVFGATNIDGLIEIAGNIISGQLKELFIKINTIVSMGRSISLLTKDLSVLFRNLVISATAPNQALDILAVPQQLLDKYNNLVNKTSVVFLLNCLDQFSSLESSLRQSLNQRILLEAVCIKLCMPSVESNPLIAIESKSNEPLTQVNNTKQAEAILLKIIKKAKENNDMAFAIPLEDISIPTIEGEYYTIKCNKSVYSVLSAPDKVYIINSTLSQFNLKLKLEEESTSKKKQDNKLADLVGNSLIIK